MEGAKEEKKRNRETREPDHITQTGALFMADVKTKMELILPSAAPADHMTPATRSLWEINMVKQACNFLFMLLSLF